MQDVQSTQAETIQRVEKKQKVSTQLTRCMENNAHKK